MLADPLILCALFWSGLEVEFSRDLNHAVGRNESGLTVEFAHSPSDSAGWRISAAANVLDYCT